MKYNYDIDESGSLIKSETGYKPTPKGGISQYSDKQTMESKYPKGASKSPSEYTHTKLDPEKDEVNIKTYKYKKRGAKPVVERGETIHPIYVDGKENKDLPKKSISNTCDDIMKAYTRDAFKYDEKKDSGTSQYEGKKTVHVPKGRRSLGVDTSFDPEKGEITQRKWNKKGMNTVSEKRMPTHVKDDRTGELKENKELKRSSVYSSDDVTVARLLKSYSPEDVEKMLDMLKGQAASIYTTPGALSSKTSGGYEGVKLMGELDKRTKGKKQPEVKVTKQYPSTSPSTKPEAYGFGGATKSISDSCDEILSKEKRISHDSNSKFTYDTDKHIGEGIYQYSDKDDSDGGKAHTYTNRATPTSKKTTYNKKYDYDPKRQEISSYHTEKPGAKKVIDTTKEYEKELKNASISDICDDLMQKAKGTKPKERSLLEGPYAEEAHKRYEARKPAIEAHAAKTKANIEATGRAVQHFRSKADEGFGEQESEEKSYSLEFNKSILERMGLEKGRKSAWESKGQKEDSDIRVAHSSDSSAGNLNPHTESRMQGIRERGEHDNLKRMAASKDPSDVKYAKKKGYSLD